MVKSKAKLALLQMKVNAFTKELIKHMTMHQPLHLSKFGGMDR